MTPQERRERETWVELCNEADYLVWRVADSRTPEWMPSSVDRDSFLVALQVAGRFRLAGGTGVGGHEARRCYLAGGSRAQVWTYGTANAGVVALAAKAGPSGPHAEEVLALAATMLMAGLTLAEETP